MHKLLQSLHRITMEMVDRLEQASIEDIGRFVEKREVIISRIKKMELSSVDMQAHKQQVDDILSYDGIISKRMNELLREAGEGKAKSAQVRKQHDAYVPTYAADSLFFDRKK